MLDTLAVFALAFIIIAVVLAVAPFIGTMLEKVYMPYCNWAEGKVKDWRKK